MTFMELCNKTLKIRFGDNWPLERRLKSLVWLCLGKVVSLALPNTADGLVQY